MTCHHRLITSTLHFYSDLHKYTYCYRRKWVPDVLCIRSQPEYCIYITPTASCERQSQVHHSKDLWTWWSCSRHKIPISW